MASAMEMVPKMEMVLKMGMASAMEMVPKMEMVLTMEMASAMEMVTTILQKTVSTNSPKKDWALKKNLTYLDGTSVTITCLG